mmetsp:Transcript_70351/g.206337  ORF Transcript_70351/g.206337 Transcript_70351/m.206337 type:complete len:207 (+) Transcript_70351:460-1080(+)
MMPRNQKIHPRHLCESGAGGSRSTRRPSAPMRKGTSPSGSGGVAKCLMLMFAPIVTVPTASKAVAAEAMAPTGRWKNGSRMVTHARQSQLPSGTTRPIRASRAAGTKARSSVESAERLRPKGTAPCRVPRSSRTIQMRTTPKTKTSEPTPPMEACTATLSRIGSQYQTRQRPTATFKQTSGSQGLSHVARARVTPSGSFATCTQPP